MRQRMIQKHIKILLTLYLLVIVTKGDIFDCKVSSINGCTSCNTAEQFILFNNDTKLYTCSNTTNCITVTGNTTSSKCVQCQTNYFPFNSICNKNITNCINHTVDAQNAIVCNQCRYEFMQLASNCSVNPKYCSNYDTLTNKCTSCPINTYLDPMTGRYCLTLIPNCLIVSYQGCTQCQQQYIIDTTVTPNTCIFSSSIAYQLSPTTAICLQQNTYYDSNGNCVSNSPIGVNYCKQLTQPGTNNCTQCIQGYFLQNTTCQSCKTTIQNCLACSPCTSPATCLASCTTCLPSHFLFTDPITQGQICRSCQIYGCKKCQVSSTSSKSITCLQCQKGQSLYNGTCYSCPPKFQFNLTSFECQPCPLNCKYCLNGVCTWCDQGYAIDSTQVNNSLKCKLINSSIFTQQLIPSTAFQILSKQFPLQQQLIYNNSVQLMSSCQQQLASKFSCVCNSSFTLVSSLCYSITTQMSKINLSSVFAAGINADVFIKNTDTVRLMAQLPGFDNINLNIQSVAGAVVYFTQDKIASLLEVYTQILRRQSPSLTRQSFSQNERLLLNTTDTLSQLFNLVSSSFSQTFSLTQTTIIYGNGYYMKYYPAGPNIIDTDTSFVTVSGRNTSNFLFVFVYFDGRNGTTSLTGNTYAYSPLTSYQLTVTVQQTQFPSASTVSYILFKNGQLDTTTQVTSPSPTVFSFPISTSTLTNQTRYQVQYQQTQITDINSLYSSERIEFIFYQPAFIYVLVFLLAYLFLIPCCSLVDFIDGNKAQRRKRVRSEDLSMSDQAKQNKRRNDQQSSQSTIQIRINYKDFFPIYNICNTPRPRRILKLCLFLLNTQHSITFLTLFYFDLQPGHPVIAVVLGVPAYFCTIIMGYIFGCFTLLKIPMWVKYGINLVAIGYWILWISLMPRFKSQQYQPFVYIFAIVFFIIDMIIDMLEMFMVYFTIKQSDRQMRMFQCLAAWLSKRGYYEYDKLARQLND